MYIMKRKHFCDWYMKQITCVIQSKHSFLRYFLIYSVKEFVSCLKSSQRLSLGLLMSLMSCGHFKGKQITWLLRLQHQLRTEPKMAFLMPSSPHSLYPTLTFPTHNFCLWIPSMIISLLEFHSPPRESTWAGLKKFQLTLASQHGTNLDHGESSNIFV